MQGYGTASAVIGGLMTALAIPALGGVAPKRAPLPFGPGERITYRVHVNGVGTIGRATMSVEGPIDVRGTPTYLLRSTTTAGIGPLKGSDVTESWFDPVAMRSLRFHERERRFLSTRRVQVEIFPDSAQWTGADGASGQSLTTTSLDELSFIYFLRSLPSERDTLYSFNSHFDAARNPVTVKVMRGETLTTPAGVFPTVLMEMRVRDPHRYHGEGVIRVYLSDDNCRIPVRIASDVPSVGSLVLSLESYVHLAPPCDMAEAAIASGGAKP